MLTTVIIRTIIIYFIVLVLVRLMGKREIGQLSPFDFVVAIMIAELAVVPMESPETPLWHGLVPLIILVVLEMGLSFIALYSHVIRKVLDGSPQVIIENGKILKKEMARSRYNLDDLMAQLREKGYPNIRDIEYGVLETSGRLSIIPKSQSRPVTPADMGIDTEYEGLPAILVMDGEVIYQGLEMCNLDKQWLVETLKERGVDVQDVFLAILDTDGDLSVIERDDVKNY